MSFRTSAIAKTFYQGQWSALTYMVHQLTINNHIEWWTATQKQHKDKYKNNLKTGMQSSIPKHIRRGRITDKVIIRCLLLRLLMWLRKTWERTLSQSSDKKKMIHFYKLALIIYWKVTGRTHISKDQVIRRLSHQFHQFSNQWGVSKKLKLVYGFALKNC